eukprot:TRINITY_DN16360_c0_g1_i1.p1 TRINITY_DN16360_c0_g1~~TRINITY_DN16360_c0_g1_i1.p1  ORF type:complete len:120 (+),score=17.61 TRINITY_DN16360_c0_g1_i1:17-376(+)
MYYFFSFLFYVFSIYFIFLLVSLVLMIRLYKYDDDHFDDHLSNRESIGSEEDSKDVDEVIGEVETKEMNNKNDKIIEDAKNKLNEVHMIRLKERKIKKKLRKKKNMKLIFKRSFSRLSL